jgi:hypothetical protein
MEKKQSREKSGQPSGIIPQIAMGETHHSSNHQVVKHPINGDTVGSMVS